MAGPGRAAVRALLETATDGTHACATFLPSVGYGLMARCPPTAPPHRSHVPCHAVAAAL